MSPTIDPTDFPFRDTRPGLGMACALKGASSLPLHRRVWFRAKGIVPAMKAFTQDLMREAAGERPATPPHRESHRAPPTGKGSVHNRGRRDAAPISRPWRFGVWSGGIAVLVALVAGLLALGSSSEAAWSLNQMSLADDPSWQGLGALPLSPTPPHGSLPGLFDRASAPSTSEARVIWVAPGEGLANAPADVPEAANPTATSLHATPVSESTSIETPPPPPLAEVLWELHFDAWCVRGCRDGDTHPGVVVTLFHGATELGRFGGLDWRPVPQAELLANAPETLPVWQDEAGNPTAIPAWDASTAEGLGVVLRDRTSAHAGPYRYRHYRFSHDDAQLVWEWRTGGTAPRLLDLDGDGVCEWIVPDDALQGWTSTAGRIGDPAIVLRWDGARYVCANAAHAAYVVWQRADASQPWPVPEHPLSLSTVLREVEGLPADLPSPERMARLTALVYAGQLDHARTLLMTAPEPLSPERRRLRELWWTQLLEHVAASRHWPDLCAAFPAYASLVP